MYAGMTQDQQLKACCEQIASKARKSTKTSCSTSWLKKEGANEMQKHTLNDREILCDALSSKST